MRKIEQNDGWQVEEGTDKSYQIACLFGAKRVGNGSRLFFSNLTFRKKKKEGEEEERNETGFIFRKTDFFSV